MASAVLPEFEDPDRARLAALGALDLVDTAPEPEFDAIVALAATLLTTPVAAITLVERDRLWVKAAVGLPFREEQRELSLCAQTIRSEGVCAISDVASDPRAARRHAAYGTNDVRAYAGAPIHAPTGERIGALCVGDPDARVFDERECEALLQLGTLVDALIAARATAREAILIAADRERAAATLERQERVMKQAERLAMIGSWRLSLDDDAIGWSDNTYRIHGLPVGQQPSLDGALDFYPPHARATVAEALAATIETGRPMDVEVDFLTAQRQPRRVRSIGELECAHGRPVAVVGVFQDVTERWTLEQALRRSADRDELTGIANRAAFNRALETAIAGAGEGKPLALALVDLDGFKAINDTLGHLAGDDVLRAVGRRLERPWLAGSFAARLGGDEFALIVCDAELAADPAALAERLEAELRIATAAGGLALIASGTVGATRWEPGDTIRDLVHRADTILYAAKRARVGERRTGERRSAGSPRD